MTEGEAEAARMFGVVTGFLGSALALGLGLVGTEIAGRPWSDNLGFGLSLIGFVVGGVAGWGLCLWSAVAAAQERKPKAQKEVWEDAD